MDIIIEHKKTKRQIKGAFTFCCGREELKQLKSIIDEKLTSDFHYGWIHVDETTESETESDFYLIKRQKGIPNSAPVNWD